MQCQIAALADPMKCLSTFEFGAIKLNWKKAQQKFQNFHFLAQSNK